MKKLIRPLLFAVAGAVILTGCIALSAPPNLSAGNLANSGQHHRIVYFNPEVFPDVEEIKFPSYQAFFDGVTDKLGKHENLKVTRVETPVIYDSIDVNLIREICENNQSDLAIVPKIKYFKVGLGKYVFSNQVVVSMKMFDSHGNMLTETTYDTYRKNKRMLGSTTNSIKIGTEGAMNEILKEIRMLNRHSDLEGPLTESQPLVTSP